MSLHTAFTASPRPLEAGARVELDSAEARHLEALRAAPGDRLLVTDGRGGLWLARLEARGRREAACTLLEPRQPPPVLPAALGFAVANKERTLWLVEKAVELGAGILQPVEFARSRSVADAARSTGFWKKARRRAVAALKQCGGARLPEMRPPTELSVYLGEMGAPHREARRLLATAAARRPLADALDGWDGRAAVTLLIGPEGGLEEGEVSECEAAGFQPVSLGPRTLRFETAAVAALATVAALAGARRPVGGLRGWNRSLEAVEEAGGPRQGGTMSDDCPFCGIVRGEVEAERVTEGSAWVAVRDINPQAPTHVLVIPREHVRSLNDLIDRELAASLLLASAEVAEREGLSDDGYRVVANTNDAGGQTVPHLHLHVLGGRGMRWPPG